MRYPIFVLRAKNKGTSKPLGSSSVTFIISIIIGLGMMIGVASVIVTVSLGEGVKQQVSNQLSQFGNDLITVRPGKSFNPPWVPRPESRR